MNMAIQSGTKWALDPVHSSVDFAVKHMVISTVRGQFGKYEVMVELNEAELEKSTVAARIDVASIDTREAQRDGHLRSPDFFDVGQYPYLTFRSTRIEAKGDGEYKLIGDLSIRNVTRPVVLDMVAGFGKDPWGKRRAGFSIEGALDRKDFGLTWNAVLETGGWLVGEKVKISVNAELVEQG